jgi:exodeoxyribonuclease III
MKGAWHGTAVLAKKTLGMKVLASKLEIRAKLGDVSPWLSKTTLELGASHIRPERREVLSCEIVKAHQEEGRILAVSLNPPAMSSTDKDADSKMDETKEIVLVATYVPNSGVNFRDPLKRLAYRVHHWDADLFAYLLDLDKAYKGRVIWCGDLNVIHREEDVSFFKRRVGCAGATHDERASFDGFLSTTPFYDAWRDLYPEDVAYSFYNAKYPSAGPLKKGRHVLDDGWRLDYFIVHEALKGHVQDVTIDLEDDSIFASKAGGCGSGKLSMRVSDHLPVSLYIDF